MIFKLTIKITSFITIILSIFFSAYAQDICSPNGISRLQSVNVTEAQISKLCSPPVIETSFDLVKYKDIAETQVDYRNVKYAIIDSNNATGKTVYIYGTYLKLSFNNERNFMSFHAITDVDHNNYWDVFFDKRFINVINKLSIDRTYPLICRITKFNRYNSECELIKISVQ